MNLFMIIGVVIVVLIVAVCAAIIALRGKNSQNRNKIRVIDEALATDVLTITDGQSKTIIMSPSQRDSIPYKTEAMPIPNFESVTGQEKTIQVD